MISRKAWSRKEFKAYLLLYAAHSDFIETADEMRLILSKVDHSTYTRIHKEFDKDNDFQSIDKITDALNLHQYSDRDIDKLLDDIKAVFLADGDYDIVERNMMMVLTHIMKKD